MRRAPQLGQKALVFKTEGNQLLSVTSVATHPQ